jgi:hypothetical protein
MGGSLVWEWTIVPSLGLTVLAPALRVDAQTTAADAEKATSGDQMGPRDVTGTVKQVSGDGIVVVGRESNGQSREWAFTLDGSTRIEKSNRTAAGSTLKVGDPVAITYVERSGKIVAQGVKLLASPGAAAPGSRPAPGKR